MQTGEILKMRIGLFSALVFLFLGQGWAEKFSRGKMQFDLAGKGGSINHISLTKSSKINSYFSLAYPLYDFSWASTIYSKPEFRDISINGALMIPALIYEINAKNNGKYDNSKSWIILFALTSLPIALANSKLRFDRFKMFYLETGFESETYYPEDNSGWSLAGNIGAGVKIYEVILGVYINQTLINETNICAQSLVTGKIGLDF